jgi:hypothetical protein
MDPVDELRLRRWARENHVPADRRDPAWSPVVLDEMTRRDRETLPPGDAGEEPLDPGARFVPLAPTVVRSLHAAHDRLADPKLLAAIDRIGIFAASADC